MQLQKLILICLLIFSFKPDYCIAQQPELVLPVGHTQDIYLTQYANNGKSIITFAYDNTAKLWDVYSGKLLYTFSNLIQTPEHIVNVQNTSLLSNDGKYLVALTVDGVIKKWELTTAKLQYAIKTDNANWTGLEYSRNGNYLLVKKSKMNVEIRNANTGKLIYTIQKKRDSYSDLAKINFSPSGNHIIQQSDSTILLLDTHTGAIRNQLNIPDVQSAFFSPDEKYCVIISHRSDSIKLWHIKDGHQSALAVSGTIILSPDSRYILSKNNGKLRLISIENGATVYEFEQIINPYMFGQFSTDGKHVFLVRNSGLIRGTDPIDSITMIWDTETRKLLYTLQTHGGDINEVVFSPDNKYVTTVSSTVQIWDAVTSELIQTLKGRTAKFSPDSKNMAVTRSRAVNVFNTGIKEIITELQGRSQSLVSIVFSPDSKQLLTTADEKSIKLWQIDKGELVKTIVDSSTIKAAAFNADGNKILLTTDDGKVIMKDLLSGSSLFSLNRAKINKAVMSKDGRKIVTASDSSICIWDAATAKLLFQKTEAYVISDVDFSLNGKYGFYIFGKSAFGVVDFETGKVYKDYFGEEEIIRHEFSPDNKYLFIQGEKGTAKLFENISGILRKQLNHKSDVEYGITYLGGYYFQNLWQSHFHHFSLDSRFLVYRAYFDKYAVVWNVEDFSITDTIHINDELINNFAFIPNTNYAVTGSRDDTIRIWQRVNNRFQLFKKLNGNGFEISPDSRWLVIADKVLLKFYDLKEQKIRFSSMAVNNTDFFTQLAGKSYYMAAKNAAKTLVFRLKNETYSFDQFDLQFNRPDLILSGLGYPDTVLINAYRQAYFKRIKHSGLKLGNIEAKKSIPIIELNGKEPYGETRDSILTIRFTARDKEYVINRCNVTVNEVPVFGKNGINLKSLRSIKVTKNIEITLSQGINIIHLYCTNEGGFESLKKTLYLNYNPDIILKEPVVHFIGIGIDRFKESKYNLEYSSKDIRDLAAKLKERYNDNILIDTLFNEQVSVSNIKALKQRLLKTSVNDKVIIAYSGHGLLSKDYDYYLSTYSINFKNPVEYGLSYVELENLMDKIPARKKLLLIDACHSGEVDKSEIFAMNNMANTLGLSKGIILNDSIVQTQQLGLTNSFELMRSLFVNIGNNTGTIIISAAAGNQFALERGDLKNGVFTYCLLEAMGKNKSIKISELKKIVGERVEKLTNGMQKPTTRNETIAVDWSL